MLFGSFLASGSRSSHCFLEFVCSALFANDTGLLRSRLSVAWKLSADADIVGVQEAHVGPRTKLPDKFTRTFLVYSSVHCAGKNTGGLLVLVRKTWAKDATIVLQTLLAGRILALHFKWSTGANLIVFICHITAERDRTWRSMATILTEAVRGIRSPCVLAGDFNILTDAGDSLTYAGTQNVIHHTADARWWNRCLDRFMCASAPWTFRHRASSSFRTLDRFYINANKSLCHLRGILVRTFGEGSSPPARGDHWPITLHWQTQSISASRSSGRFASHVHKHPSWQVTLQRYLDCIDTDLPWRAKWAQMQLAFADAAAEIS
eukprot:6492457-Amphidinium_carterae.3